jgi:serpin B
MTYEGAHGLTAEEMASVLNIQQDNESFHQYMQELYTYLNESSEYNISTSNALWPRIGYQLLQDYIDIIETFYGGTVSEIDYSNPEQAAEIINSWVENRTNNLIQDLVAPSEIDPVLTYLILTNAIYFKGAWEIEFDKDNTTDREFTTSSGERIDVPTMCLVNTEDSFNYTENDNFQVLELPYNGNEISMMIFLPKDDYESSDIVNSMNKDTYSELIDSMTIREVDIYLPKFKIKTPLYELNDYLKNMGMTTAFGFDADFSGLDGVGKLYINKVLHKAFIEVNGEGTEAAAATAVMMVLKSTGGDDMTRLEFDCDHPFLFTINHKETGTILFMGTIENPA